MTIRIGLNGFGRVGRIIFRSCLQRKDVEITAINDPAINIEYICYLIKYDSTHGKYNGEVRHFENEIIIDGKFIKVYHEKQVCFIPWGDAEVEYVVEASGAVVTLDKALDHLSSEGVKLIVVTAPSVDVPMIILGVNDHTISPDEKVISSASSTLYCLAPAVRVLESNYGIAEGFVTTIHAMTPSLKPLDSLCVRGKHWRDHRSIHQNIIPAASGACRALSMIIPQVTGKLAGIAFRVPIADVSVLDLTVRLKTDTSLENVIKCFDRASSTYMKGIVSICTDQSVSSDFIGDSHSCILDAGSCLQLKPDYYKLIFWYENEYSYACRVLDTIVNVEKKFNNARTQSKMTYVKTKSPYKLYRPIESFSAPIRASSPINLLDQSMLMAKKLFKKPGSHSSAEGFTHYRRQVRAAELLRIWNHSHNPKMVSSRNRAEVYQNYKKYATCNKSCLKSLRNLNRAKRELDKMTFITEKLLKTSCINLGKTGDEIDSSTDKQKVCEGNIAKTNEKSIKDEDKNYADGDCKENNDKIDLNKLLSNNIDDFNVNIKESVHVNNLLGEVIPNKSIINLNICVTPVRNRKRKLYTRKHTHIDRITKRYNLDDHFISKQYPNSHAEGIHDMKAKPELTEELKIEDNSKCIELVDRYEGEKIPVLEPEVKSDSGNVSSKRSQSNILLKFSASFANFVLKLNLPKENTNEDNTKIDSGMFSLNAEVDKELCDENAIQNKPEIKWNDDLKETVSLLDVDTQRKNVEVMEHAFTEKAQKIKTVKSIKLPRFVKCQSEDIFDKLDSVSGSGSESSFEVNKKKSQVIYINDLTTSLEDLGRLDKLCKILEISDELSDKLFLPLKSSQDFKLYKQKWSFKDLCEKIKLDEFCEKVFGK